MIQLKDSELHFEITSKVLNYLGLIIFKLRFYKIYNQMKWINT